MAVSGRWAQVDVERRCRECPGCRRRWPEQQEHCVCLRWLGEALRVLHERCFVPSRPWAPGPAAAGAWRQLWTGLPDSFRGPLVQDLPALTVVTRTPIHISERDPRLQRWLAQLPELLADAGAFVLRATRLPVLTALFAGHSPRDQIERAADTALAVERLASESGFRSALSPGYVGIGLALAPVAVSRPSSGASPERWKVEGGGIELAQHLALCSEHGGGPTLSEGAYLLARGSYRVFGTRPATLEPDANLPRTVYVLQDRKPTVTWRALLDGQTGPLVDRVHELEQLHRSWARACAGDLEVVHLVAEPGIGKSRLLDAFADEIAGAHGSSILRAWGACFGGRRFQLLAELLEPLWSDEPGSPVHEGGDAEVVGDAVGQLLRRRLAGPVALVLDDLHWADAASLESLPAIAEGLRGRPTLLVLSYRPSLLERRRLPAAFSGQVLELQALAPADAAQLAERELGGLPGVWPSAILAAARGNPLFVEEAAALVREGAFHEGEDPTAVLPRTLFGLLLRRIDVWSDRALGELEQATSLSWGASSGLAQELEAIKGRVGDWLDRIEGGSYLGPVESAVLLSRLRTLELRTQMLHWRLGHAAARNDRLREAVSRVYAAGAERWLDGVDEYVRETGDVGSAVTHTIQAAEAARLRREPAAVVALLRRSLELAGESTPLSAPRKSLDLQLAESLQAIGDLTDAGTAYLAAGQPGRAAAAFVQGGEGEAARDALYLPARGEEDGAAHAIASAGLAWADGQENAGALLADAVDAAVAAGDESLEVQAAAQRFQAYSATCWEAAFLDLLRAWRDGGPRRETMPALLALARAPTSSGGGDVRRQLTERYLARAAALAEELGGAGWIRQVAHVREEAGIQ